MSLLPSFAKEQFLKKGFLGIGKGITHQKIPKAIFVQSSNIQAVDFDEPDFCYYHNKIANFYDNALSV